MKQYWNEGSFVPDKEPDSVMYVTSAPTSWDEPISLKKTDCEMHKPKVFYHQTLTLSDAKILRSMLDDAIRHQERMIELAKQEEEDVKL